MHHRSLLIVFLGIMLFAVSGFAADPEFVSMFNGTDLTGWHEDCRAADAGKNTFTAESGVIVMNVQAPLADVWLTYDTELTDFIIRLKFKAYQDATGNSGLQFRDYYVNSAYPRHGFDIASNVPQSTGFIWDYQESWLPYPMSGYEESNFTPYLPAGWTYKWSTDADPWNTYEVSCIGTRVKSVLNGKTIIDWDGGSTILPKGNVALQAHGRQMFRIDFKDLELADLTATGIQQAPENDTRQGAADVRMYDLAGRPAGEHADGVCFLARNGAVPKKILIVK